MRKFLIPLFILITILIITGCKKNSPFAPANAPIPIASYTDLASVPGGIFTQTDAYNTANAYTSTVSAFKMGKYQVTYELWYTVYQWAIDNGYTFQNAGAEGCFGTSGAITTTAKYQPVTTISWRDAIVWCNAYSQKNGLTPIYCSDVGLITPIKSSASGVYGSSINTAAGSFDNPYVNWSANGYRLPTEGEYQCAASYIDGSSWTPYNYASGATADYTNTAADALVAWDIDNSIANTHVVGGKTANALGIYDMSGNVWEWCWDWYGTYPTTASINYTGPLSGSDRVIRGGAFSIEASSIALGARAFNYPYFAGPTYGFRFARTY